MNALNGHINISTHHATQNDEYYTVEELDTVRRKNVNAQDSWFTFVRHSKRPQNNKQPRKRKEKKSKRLACAHGCVPGPAGPRGPPGPPGPAGAVITKEILMQEFKELVREAAERRALELLAEKCPSCTDNLNITSSSIPVSTKNNVIDSVARIAVGFNMRLRRNVAISGRTFMELGAFHQPFAAGSFNRGENFNIKNGRFGAPKSGIYQFSVNLHMRIKRNGRRLKLRKQDNIRAQICIDSLCQKYAVHGNSEVLDTDKPFYIAQLLVNNINLTRQVWKIGESAVALTSSVDTNNSFSAMNQQTKNIIYNYLLDSLPNLFTNEVFQNLTQAVFDELSVAFFKSNVGSNFTAYVNENGKLTNDAVFNVLKNIDSLKLLQSIIEIGEPVMRNDSIAYSAILNYLIEVVPKIYRDPSFETVKSIVMESFKIGYNAFLKFKNIVQMFVRSMGVAVSMTNDIFKFLRLLTGNVWKSSSFQSITTEIIDELALGLEAYGREQNATVSTFAEQNVTMVLMGVLQHTNLDRMQLKWTQAVKLVIDILRQQKSECGNDNLHAILSEKRKFKVRFVLVDVSGEHAYAEYSNFYVGNEESNYELNISSYFGTAGDGARDHTGKSLHGMMFSTKDRDNDLMESSCAIDKCSGWWHRSCTLGNINGKLQPGNRRDISMHWKPWRGWFSLQETTMMIKPLEK
ncbi:Hypothetical predicted protein [Mytilus galloprovincialis]|uniref:Fibrinogen C-terminal domain-containing protein n=1 Tax=Mytilus galloprovincialis TaxID=29158 RepID=A0A8B6H4Y1_MYTGA|nr:Hypothetical predicted protein [Mytilus galloprovincialis]